MFKLIFFYKNSCKIFITTMFQSSTQKLIQTFPHSSNQPDSGSAPSSSAPSNSTTTTSAPSGNPPSSAPSQQQQQLPPSNGGPMPPHIPASTITTPSVIGSITSPAKNQHQPPLPPQPQPQPQPQSHQQQQQQHHAHQHTSSPTPLAFTPTSVLRKMTAEKENEQLATAVSNAAVANREERRGDILGNLGLSNPLTQQQQRNLSALMGQHPPPPPPNQQQGPPPQIAHQQQPHPGMGHHPIGVPPMGHPQGPLRGGNQQQQPGMPGGNIPWNLKQPHPGQQQQQQQMPQMAKPQGRPILKGELRVEGAGTACIWDMEPKTVTSRASVTTEGHLT